MSKVYMTWISITHKLKRVTSILDIPSPKKAQAFLT